MNTRNIRFSSNKVKDIKGLYHADLDSIYGCGEVDAFLFMLFEAFLGWDKVRLLTSSNQTINQSDLLRFHWALEDLKQYRPIQHIIGYTDFCGCRIAVSPDVLIPRPETEEMVQWIISALNTQLSTFNILDLCTGSGSIAIALKKAFPAADVTAVDVSPEALKMARQNAKNNDVEVRFEKGDVLALPSTELTSSVGYGLIVSNPPYVMEKERMQMQRNVLDHEPALALFVPDDDPLRFYHAIAEIAKTHLSDDGLLAIEINEVLADETSNLLRQRGFLPEIHSDFREKKRFITATRPSK